MIKPKRGKAVKVLSFGVIVELDDGREGFLPRREFATPETRDLRQVVEAGQVFDVVESQESKRGRTLLRLASDDAWDSFVAEVHAGASMSGVVRNVEPYGVFVDLRPGVTGLVRSEELAAWPIKRVEQVLWVGDAVRVVVQEVIRKEERVALSMRGAASERSQALRRSEALPTSPREGPASPVVTTVGEEPWSLALNVLIVDDEPQVARQLVDRLKKWGHITQQVSNAEEALQLARECAFDVIVMDVGLPNMNGVQAAQRLLESKQRAHVVLMTDWASATDLETELQGLGNQGVELVIKPNHEIELSRVLTQLYATSPGPKSQRPEKSAKARAGYLSEASLQHSLSRILRSLRQQTGAAEIILFAVDPRTRSLVILAREGRRSAIRVRELQAHWIYSPIRDVIQDQQVVFARDVAEQSAAFKYLRRALDFCSCIGVPVPAEDPAGLFAFHTLAGHFAHTDRRLAIAAGERIAAVLDRHAAERALIEAHRYVLLGQLGAVVVHEVNNKMGAARYDVGRLQEDLAQLKACWETQGKAGRAWEQVYNKARDVARTTETLVQLASGFDSLVRQQEPGRLDIHVALAQAIQTIRPLASRRGIEVHTRYHEHPLRVQGVASWLDQAFSNLLLNAVQQIGLGRPDTGGHVLVSTHLIPGDSARPLHVRIHDDGPGIHTAHWERIFDLGFTTRKEGSGLGLFVTRRLIESLGGRVRVEESYRLWGTTMLVELPVLRNDVGEVSSL
jgi:signal transduction histidine kinase/predicted RNA-binding protein with RPS1 domain/ActR/RegA family two-component response regulator